MVQSYFEKESLTREDMLNDLEFLNDSFFYMLDRTGNGITDPNERIDELMELMRVSQVNEISAVQNLTHARSADDRGKELMGKMFLAYDKSEGATGFWDKILDYGEGLVTSPTTVVSSLLAVPTLGGSLAVRGGAQAGVQATNLAVRAIIKGGMGKFVKQQALRSAGRAAAVEAPLGALTMGTEAASRRETGREEFQDIDVLQQTLLGGAIGGVTAGVLGGAAGAISAKTRGFKGLQRLDKFYESKQARIETGIAKTKDQIKANPADAELIDDLVEKMSKKTIKDPLNREIVGFGQRLKRQMIPIFSRGEGKPRFAREGVTKEGDTVLREPFTSGLNPDVMRNASAAAIEIIRKSIQKTNPDIEPKDLVELLKTKRITEVLHEALKDTVDGKYTLKTIEQFDPITGKMKKIEVSPWEDMYSVMREYGLSPQEFSHVYMAEVSDAARILQQQSVVSRQMDRMLNETGEQAGAKLKGIHEDLSYIQQNQHTPVSTNRLIGELPAPQEYLDNIKVFSDMVEKYHPVHSLKKGWTVLKNLDKTRLGLMTIQPATTIRNTANGVARLATFALDNLFHGAMTGDPKKMLAGPRAIGAMLNPTEAQMLKIIFSEEMPETFVQLYRKAADIEEASGKKSSMVQVARWLNGMNTYTDNAFKRAIFMAELTNRVGKKTLLDHMADGRFTEIPNMENHISEAMQEALSFTYQKGYRATGGGWWETRGNRFIKTFNRPGLSMLVPFPRFTANSIEFMYKHAPLIGLMDLPAKVGKSKLLGPSSKNLAKFEKLSPDGKNAKGDQIIQELKGSEKFEEALFKENLKRARELAKETEVEQMAMKAIPKRIANQATGLAMLYGAIQLRAQQGPTASWWEMYDEDTGKYKQSMAFYGPFAIYMLAADIIIKSSDFGKNLIVGDEGLKKQWENTAKQSVLQQLNVDRFGEFLKATAGPQFKTGMGSDWVRSVQNTVNEYSVATDALNPNAPNYQTQVDRANNRLANTIAGAMGNMAATFLVPLGAVRDVMAGFDPEEWQGMKATDNISPADLFIKKALRALPINSEGEYFGIVSSEGLAKFVPFTGKDKGLASQDIVTATKTPDTEAAQRREGIKRQFTGLASPSEKNVLEKELERQNLKAYKLFPRIPQSSQLTRSIREYYQKQVVKNIIPYINSARYKAVPTHLKAEMLSRHIKKYTSNPLGKTQEILLTEYQNTESGSSERKIAGDRLGESLQIQFRKIGKVDRVRAIGTYRELNNDRNPDFNNLSDMLALLAYAKASKTAEP